MFRHSSSLVVSLIVHALLLGGVFYSYKSIVGMYEAKQAEKETCIELSCLCNEEVVAEKKVAPPKIIPKKLEKKPKPKKKPVKKVEKVVHVKEIKEVHKEEESQELVLEEEMKKELPEPSAASIASSELKDTKEMDQKSAEKAYMDENIRIIIKLLQENFYYPRSARKRGLEGEVVVKFTLSKDAEVISCEVLSSQHDILSRGAIETIESLSGKFPKPKETLQLSVPINYSLKR